MNPHENDRERRRRLHQLVDCCRPGSDDALQPEMAELGQGLASDNELRTFYERSQRFDAAVAAAFHDVPVPEGLAERLQNALLSPAPNDHVSREVEDEEPVDPVLAASRPLPNSDRTAKPTSISRPRRLGWGAVAAASAAAILLLGVVSYAVWHLSPTVVSTEEVIDRALKWTGQAKEYPWDTEMSLAPLKRFPRERSLRVAPFRWQMLTTADRRNLVAYDLAPPGKPFVAQFTMPVSPSAQFHLPRSLPSQPTSSTGGFCIGACVRDGYLYVLVVEGDATRYRQFVRPEPPVT